MPHDFYAGAAKLPAGHPARTKAINKLVAQSPTNPRLATFNLSPAEQRYVQIQAKRQPVLRPAQTAKPDYRGPETHAAVPYGQPGYKPVDTGAPRHKVAPKGPSVSDLIFQNQTQAIGPDVLKQAANPRVAALHDILGAATGIPSTVDALRKGNIGRSAIDVASLLPIGRFGRAAELLTDAERAAKVEARVARAAKDAYQPRVLKHNDLEATLPKARAKNPVSKAVVRGIENSADVVSQQLQKSARAANTPGLRLSTSGERAAKAAGRAQKIEQTRAGAAFGQHLDAIKAVKAGSDEDVANFWYAQLPKTHRNPDGLRLVRGEQAKQLQYVTSGKALEDLTARENAVKAKLGAIRAENPDDAGKAVFPLVTELQDIKVAKTDLPNVVKDTAASIVRLDKVIKKAPTANDAAINAVHALGNDRSRILVESGRLQPERAQQRTGLVSRMVGAEPTGEEAYIGHRAATPENARYPYTPSGGVGRVASPKGMSQNNLALARNGRLRQSLRVAAEDWSSAQAFHHANVARGDLAKLGTEFSGSVPAGHSLVNPRGRTVPAAWKTEDLAQFSDGYEDVENLRKRGEEIVKGFLGSTPEDFERMKQDAIDQGVDWNELRVVPNRLVDRYYKQFRSSKSRGTAMKAYDGAIDAVTTSIVFARVGYIPKNLVQNIIMAVPHQGAFFLQNATWAAQVARDPELRRYALAEVGHTGATGALANEAMSKKVTGAVASFMSKGADDPVRLTALMHEIGAAGVVPRSHLLLTDADRARLVKLFTSKADRPLLNDIRSRGVEAMADFSRMTPDQSRVARRFVVIPGWLMAGSRYPFHFAATHPVRSALLAYIALGEPGAPDHFNKPIDQYFKGSSYRQGIEIGGRRLRTNSLSPVSTPWELGAAVKGTVQGKTGPFDFTTPTAFDEVQPGVASAIGILQGEGIKKSVKRLFPNVTLAQGLINPKASKTFPEDANRLGRLKREVGVWPIKVNDPPDPSQAAKDWRTRHAAMTGLEFQMNKLRVPDGWRKVYRKGEAVATERVIAESEAKRGLPKGQSLTAAQTYKITMDTLHKAGMMTDEQYHQAVAAIPRMTHRELEHWKDSAWDQLGPGKLLSELHHYYNVKTGR